MSTLALAARTEELVSSVPGGDPRVVDLASATWRVGILPCSAGAIAYAKVLVDGVWRDLLRPTGLTKRDSPTSCASFPLIPWSNRVADAKLTFGGQTWQLPRTSPDGTAMHGSVLPFSFEVLDQTESSVRLGLDSRQVVGMGFPWEFTTELVYTVTDAGLTVTTTVTNVDAEAFPAGFGHHPYFVRSLTPGCGEPQLEIPVTCGYALESAMAVAEAGPLPARADYSSLRPLGGKFVDDCLTGRVPGPVRIVYPGARADGSDIEVHITADDVYSHWVVYVPVHRAYFAVEPATNANGGFALAERGVAGSGVFVLEPGESKTGTFTVSL